MQGPVKLQSTRSVIRLLNRLVLACLLPGVIGSASFLLFEYHEERQRQVEDTVRIARTLGDAVDARLLHAQSVVDSMALMSHAAGGDLRASLQDAARAMSAALGARVEVIGPENVVPAAARMAVSDLARDPISGRPAVMSRVPLAFAPGYALAVWIPSEKLTALLVERRLPSGWLGSLLDREGIIIGRSRFADRYVGQPAGEVLRSAIARSDSGSLETLTRDGVVNHTAYSRSPRTGFTTVVGIPRSHVVAPLATKLAWLAAAAILLSAGALLLARRMSLRLSAAIQSLLPPAMALGRGERQTAPPAAIAEVDEVGAAIERAATLLSQRQDELHARHEELQQFKFFSENANEMLLLFDEEGHVRYANRKASQRLGYSNEELMKMSVFDLDLPVLPERFRMVFEQSRTAPPPPFERVYTAKDGTEIPVEITTTVLEHRGEWLMHVAPRDISERRQAEQAMRWAATHDALTGLANRARASTVLDDMLKDARAGAGGGAVLFIDLDRFKPINDIHGHETGDRVLRELAVAMQTCLGPRDLLARIGGDEFLALLHENGEGARTADQVAADLLQVLARPVHVGKLEVSLSASIGISRFPEHGDTASALVHAADMAMFQAKHAGRAAAVTYSPALGAQAQFTLSVESRLQHALDHDGLLVHYQPIVNLATGAVEGVEALVRIDERDGPAPGPATFIPVAESTGLIVPLGAWIARESCRQQAAWHAQGLPLSIAVNVSAIQFRRADFAGRVRAALARSGMDPQCLVIELTETALMENLAEATAILREVKSMGVRIALDDFGTGYSSLSVLSSLPLDKLKIDQSFIRRIDTDHASRVVIDAVIAMANSLGLELVAEGIESESALRYLRERGCRQGQGYYFSRPLPGPLLEEWVAQRRR